MSDAPRGALLPELLLALVLFGLGLAPAAWLLARAERLTAVARTQERVARAGLDLLDALPAVACGAAAGVREGDGVQARWTAAGDTLRTVTADVRARAYGVRDTLVTRLACP